MSKQNLIEVTLAKHHTHGGRKYPPGEKIQVTEPERDWLVEQKVINALPAAKEPK